MNNVYNDFDLIVLRIMQAVNDVHNEHPHPALVVIARDIEIRIRNAKEMKNFHGYPSHPITGLCGLDVSVSSMLPDGSFMVLTSDDVAIMELYKEIIRKRVTNVEGDMVDFDIEAFNKKELAVKTYLLEGYNADKGK